MLLKVFAPHSSHPELAEEAENFPAAQDLHEDMFVVHPSHGGVLVGLG